MNDNVDALTARVQHAQAFQLVNKFKWRSIRANYYQTPKGSPRVAVYGEVAGRIVVVTMYPIGSRWGCTSDVQWIISGHERWEECVNGNVRGYEIDQLADYVDSIYSEQLELW